MSTHHKAFIKITIPPPSLVLPVRRKRSWLVRLFEPRMPKEGYAPASWFDLTMTIVIVVACAVGLGMAWIASR